MAWSVVPVLAVGNILTAAAWNTVADNMTDSTWIAPSLNAGWSVYSGYTVGYRRIGNMVRLRGVVNTSSGTAFTLPSGYYQTTEPTLGFNAQQIGSAGNGLLEIDSSGNVVPPSSGIQSTAYLDSALWWID